MHPQPRVPDVDLVESELLEASALGRSVPTAKFFGKLALGLLCLALGLLAAGVGHPLNFVAYFVAQFVNRRLRKSSTSKRRTASMSSRNGNG